MANQKKLDGFSKVTDGCLAESLFDFTESNRLTCGNCGRKTNYLYLYGKDASVDAEMVWTSAMMYICSDCDKAQKSEATNG